MCREIIGTRTNISFRDSIQKACTEKNDDWAAEVRLQLEGAVSDLHAADARYHVDCKSKFLSPSSVASAVNSTTNDHDKDPALEFLLHEIADKKHVWNSVDLFAAYIMA